MLGIMLAFDGAWIPAIVLVFATGAWWWLFARQNDLMCTSVTLQPLLGAIGLAPAASAVAGALMDVKEAVCATAMMAMSAIVFASIGSGLVSAWGVGEWGVSIVAFHTGRGIIEDGFVSVIADVGNWSIMASWILGAAAFSALCSLGKRVYDVLGAVAFGAVLILGSIIVPQLLGSDALSPPSVGGVAVAVATAFAFALFQVTDRVRMKEGEW